MANKDITPDSLATKTFAVTILGALLYIAVVFVFVIGGNRREEKDNPPEHYEHPGAQVHGVVHHD
jgi:hypothetical protein